MSGHEQQVQQLRERVEQARRFAPQVLSQAEAQQVESRLLVSEALLLLLAQLSPSGTPSAPQA